MKIRHIQQLLDAKLLCHGDNLDAEVTSAFGCDLMSDVLAYVKDQSVLLTGLVNPQVIRTAIMLDMVCVVFVRSKTPTDEILALAEESGIVVMSTTKTLYESCGIIYSNGLSGKEKVE